MPNEKAKVLESISPNEMAIILELRSLRPFEKVEIMADKGGKIGTYFVTRTFKVVFDLT